MSKILTNNQYYSEIADIIREQNGTNNTYKPSQMASALKNIFYEEVTGTTPLTFQGIGKNLIDYRINGASGGVGDKTKNLLNITASTSNYQGVRITINKDKSITLYGTASNNAWVTIQTNNILDVGQYILTGAVNNAILRYQKNVSGYGYDDIGEGRNINITEKTTTGIINLRIVENVFYDNVTIYPMIRLATEDNTYEPYGYKIPVVINGKNLWNDTNASISPTDGDKIIKNNHDYILNEFTTENEQVIRLPFELNENETYTLSFDAYADENNTKVLIDGQPDNIYNQNLIADTPVFISSTLTRYSVPLTLLNGNTDVRIYRVPLFDNATTSKIYISNIQLEKGLEATPYEEYIASTTTTIYTNNSIGENESISLADTNTNIMTINGTNILTTNTTIQPSSIYVKSRHKSIYDK